MTKAGYIAIVGRPNAGKSTLLNTVLGTEISIVTPKAQTTRESVLGILTEDQGQIVFIDTPGIHRAREGGLNQFMVSQAEGALKAPDLVWYLVDPHSRLEHEQAVLDLLKGCPSPVILLLNKIDWLKKKIPLDTFDQLENSLVQAMKDQNIQIRSIKRISALSKLGVNDLLEESWSAIPEGPHFYSDPDQLSDRPTRFFVAEKIREQLYHHLGDEIPYSCAVFIENFDETTRKIPHIDAVIYVERESQKGIVIGQGGKKIKDIGQSARVEIEKFLGQSIFLGLKVKVLKEWSRNADELRRLGYDLPNQRRSHS